MYAERNHTKWDLKIFVLTHNNKDRHSAKSINLKMFVGSQHDRVGSMLALGLEGPWFESRRGKSV
jgi:hypothetical protein